MKKLFIVLPLLALCAGCASNHYEVRDGRVNWVHAVSFEMESDPVKQADPATLRQFSYSIFDLDRYAADRNHVYYDGIILPGADPATFGRLKGDYWKDKNHVYDGNDAVPGADPGSFRYLGYDSWWRDNHNIYAGNMAVNPRDISTFQRINAEWARDSKWYYPLEMDHYSPIEKLDYASFRILRGGWARDRYRVYYYSRTVPVADLKSFRVIDEDRACDDAWLYDMGWKRMKLADAIQQGLVKDIPPAP